MSAPPVLERPDQDQLFEFLAPRAAPAGESRAAQENRGPTLLATLHAAWEGLRAHGVVPCPACGARMERIADEGSCSGCGSRLS